MQKLEILAPAGNIQKLKIALHFGADAVYLGGKDFSLRSFAGNFSRDEMIEAVKLCHERGKKIYTAVNIFARNDDFSAIPEYFRFLQDIGVDAAIVSDIGVFEAAKKHAPKLAIHISTQANTLNKYTAKFWKELGAQRVILGRELSIKEISEIRDYIDMELEAFVHGAMCVAYSGRCYLSEYLTGRDGNRGECVQPCRWKYYLMEEKRPGEFLPAHEDERGSYIMSSKDLNLLPYLKELIESGVSSFKIEGRMKSEYYVAAVTNAYRRALNEIQSKGLIINTDKYLRELEKISHREYTAAYALDRHNQSTISSKGKESKGSMEFCAVVLNYDEDSCLATVEMRNRFKTDEPIEVLSPSGFNGTVFHMPIMKNREGEEITDAKIVQDILTFKSPVPLLKGDILIKDMNLSTYGSKRGKKEME